VSQHRSSLPRFEETKALFVIQWKLLGLSHLSGKSRPGDGKLQGVKEFRCFVSYLLS